MSQLILTLYVSERSARLEKVLNEIHRICEKHLPEGYEIEVVDVLKDPDRAERDRVLATPTLEKTAPMPIRRVIGDLSETVRALAALGLVTDGSCQ